jgi:tetratricopeptide (TPR) repeat protein
MTARTADRTLECFREATALDPTYALAWAGIADSYPSRLFASDVRPSDVMSDARAAAARALTTGPDVAEAHAAVARVQILFDWDWRSAETHLRRSVTLNPGSTQTYWLLGHALSRQERHEEALAAASRALAFDPLDALGHSMAAQIAYSAGRLELAAAHAKASLHVEPDFWVGQCQLAEAYERMGRTDEASDLLAHAARLSDGNSKALSLSTYVMATAVESGKRARSWVNWNAAHEMPMSLPWPSPWDISV